MAESIQKGGDRLMPVTPRIAELYVSYSAVKAQIIASSKVSPGLSTVEG